MNDIGVVIVCYNTPGLIAKAVASVFNHVDCVVVVDNSQKGSECYRECDALEQIIGNVFVHHTHENIGHGPGLNLGISQLSTKYVICMDSDAELRDPFIIDEMKGAMGAEGVFGAGRVLTVQKDIPYLYLPFCMFKRDKFLEGPRFIHDGAPFIASMRAIKGKYHLVDIPQFSKKVYHHGRATREIAGNWRKDFGGRDGI